MDLNSSPNDVLPFSNLPFTENNFELMIEIMKTMLRLTRAFLQTMDKKFAPNWHCIMGGSLGFEVALFSPKFLRLLAITYQKLSFCSFDGSVSQVVCEKHSLLYMYYGGNCAILLFKY